MKKIYIPDDRFAVTSLLKYKHRRLTLLVCGSPKLESQYHNLKYKSKEDRELFTTLQFNTPLFLKNIEDMQKKCLF